jgi:predicted transcriptional regulator
MMCMKHTISLALDSDMIQAIQRLAVAEERSRSSVANRLLRAALAAADPKPASPVQDVS